MQQQSNVVVFTPPSPQRGRTWHHVAVRLADEGVPVGAIIRSLLMPAEEVRDILKEASENGLLVALPRDDWPPGTRREARMPDTVPIEIAGDELLMRLMRMLKLTESEARVFSVLLRRPQAAKGTLHQAVQRIPSSADEQSDIKIVDVFICKIRTKLDPLGITIDTLWGKGYSLTKEGREAAIQRLGLAEPAGDSAPPGSDLHLKHVSKD